MTMRRRAYLKLITREDIWLTITHSAVNWLEYKRGTLVRAEVLLRINCSETVIKECKFNTFITTSSLCIFYFICIAKNVVPTNSSGHRLECLRRWTVQQVSRTFWISTTFALTETTTTTTMLFTTKPSLTSAIRRHIPVGVDALLRQS